MNFFASDNNDLHGEAFEFLEINSGIKQSDLGQYFTPQPIINFMVNFAHLNIDVHKKIYDPFLRHRGFLIKTFSHFKTKLNSLNNDELKHLKSECFYGQEAFLETARFAKMNMI
ncbi:MAG: N-6 DNA methylase ['Waltheria sp.' little leaf phytoplasma]|nr:N-6 DNA methylase ['Waltheria sp.' little leaf phytoplasma]